MKRGLRLILLALFLFLTSSHLAPDSVFAATFIVSSTSDGVDANPGDGICATVGGFCTLRAAIMEANALAGTDTITLPAGIYTLTTAGADEDIAATGDLDITQDLTINGAGLATSIIDGNNMDRIIDVLGGTVTINGVTIRNGNPGVVFDGGGIRIGGAGTLALINSDVSGNTASSGGGLFVDAGSLNLINSTVNGNTAPFGGGINNNFGNLMLDGSTINGNSGGHTGGILSNSALTLTNSDVTANSEGGIRSIGGSLTLDNTVVSGNTAPHTSGGGVSILTGSLSAVNSTISNNSAVSGGGISNNSGTLTLTDVSLSNNTAINWGGGMESFGQVTMTNVTIDNNSAASGGGIFDNGGTEILTNCTISGNTANVQGGGAFNRGMLTLDSVTVHTNSASLDGGGGIFNFDGTVSVKNTILSGSLSGENCSGVLASMGHNLSSDNTCGFTGPGDLSSTNPLLGPLANNGGPTRTHDLLPGSPAIDAADPATFPATDQRGVTRPQGAGPDVGAYEFVPATVTTVSIPTMTEWGMLVFTVLAGIMSVNYLRKNRLT
jgi:CSLREA domain-containing protein